MFPEYEFRFRPFAQTKVMNFSRSFKGQVQTVVVVVNHCFTSLFGTKGLLSDIVMRSKRCSQLMR